MTKGPEGFINVLTVAEPADGENMVLQQVHAHDLYEMFLVMRWESLERHTVKFDAYVSLMCDM